MDGTRISDLPLGTPDSTSYIPFDNGVQTQKVPISNYATKDADAVTGNVAKFDANGNPIDSGYPTNNILGLSFVVVSTWT